MELEGLFSSTRWEILSLLSRGKYSPMQIAEELGTTSANISQQLRLLELAGLVKSERTRESDKKKPRILYYLADSYSYLILTSDGYASKKLLPTTNYAKYFLKSMFIQNEEYHRYIGMFYWVLFSDLHKIDLIAVDNTSPVLKMVVAADKKYHNSIDKNIKKSEYKKKGFKHGLMTLQEVKRSISGMFILYDPNNIEGEMEG